MGFIGENISKICKKSKRQISKCPLRFFFQLIKKSKKSDMKQAFTVGTVLLFLLILSPSAYSKIEGCKEKIKCDALNKYRDGLAFRASQWRQALDSFYEAVTIIPDDANNMPVIFKVKRIVKGGYRPKVEYVSTKKNYEYLPNKQIVKIKSKHPPKAEIVLKMGCVHSDLCRGLPGNSEKKVGFQIVNNGETRFDELSLRVASDMTGGNSSLLNFGNLEPQQEKEKTERLPVKNTVYLTFTEKYNFVPPKLTFSLQH